MLQGPPSSHPSIVLLEPGFPVYYACSLLWAGIASLAHAAGCFARQPKGDNGTVSSTLPEPDPRQLSRGINLRAAHIRQATGWASLGDLNQASSHFFLCNGLEQQVSREKRHQGELGQHVQ